MLKLSEIANIAGVSAAAVSLVLHNKKGVGREKRDEIKALLQTNGYSLDVENKKRKNIQFLKYIETSEHISGNPEFINAIIDSVEQECRDRGYSLTITTFSDILSAADFVNLQRPDGVILLGTEISDEDMGAFTGLNARFVVVDNLLPLTSCHSISMDNYAPIFMAVKHLIDLGHRQVGFLRAKSHYSGNCEARMRAFIEAMEFYGVGYNPELMFNLDPSFNGAYNKLRKLALSGVRFPSAIVCSSDIVALSALKVFGEFGIQVPSDISLVGFDNISFCELSTPPLTTINVPCRDIGVCAVRLLCDLIEDATVTKPHLKVQIGTTFVLRKSTMQYIGSSSNPHVL